MDAATAAVPLVDGHRHQTQRAMVERRRTKRARCHASVELKCADGTFTGVCNDISLGGMLFLGPLVSVGQGVKLSMDLAGFGTVRVEGEVVAHRDHPEGWGLAIRFASLSQHDLKAINQFVFVDDRRN